MLTALPCSFRILLQTEHAYGAHDAKSKRLDLNLIRNIDRDAGRQAVVRATVSMCKELGIGVVAEGVETLEEWSCLEDLCFCVASRPIEPHPINLKAKNPEIKQVGRAGHDTLRSIHVRSE